MQRKHTRKKQRRSKENTLEKSKEEEKKKKIKKEGLKGNVVPLKISKHLLNGEKFRKTLNRLDRPKRS